MSEHVIERTNAGFGVMVSGQRKKATVMTDGPIYRSDDEVAEYRLTHAERAGWRIMDTLPEKIREQLFGMLEQDSEMPRD